MHAAVMFMDPLAEQVADENRGRIQDLLFVSGVRLEIESEADSVL